MAIRIWLEDSGVADILRYNSKLEELEQDMMMKRLDQVKAEFLQSFGFEGEFVIKAVQTQPGQTHGRLTYRISAVPRTRTSATLYRNPGWLSKFMSGD